MRRFAIPAATLLGVPIIALIIGMTLTTSASTQVAATKEPNLRQIISGDRFPLSVQLKELNEEWRRVSLSGGAGENPLAAMFGSGAGDAYYTRGETVKIGEETYLIAYQLPSPVSGMAAMFGGGAPGADAPALSGETKADLSLLNLRSAGSLTGIRAFNLEEELKEAERLRAMMSAFGGAG